MRLSLSLSQLSDKIIIKIESPFPAMKMSSCFPPPCPVKVIAIVGSFDEMEGENIFINICLSFVFS
jgi:hypothetical protein